MGFFILEIIGVILFLACIAFYFFYPVERDRFLFGTKSWLGSLSFCCILVIGLVLTISFCNHVGFLNGHGRFINPKNLVDWDSTESTSDKAIYENYPEGNTFTFENPESNSDDSYSSFAENNFFAIISQFADPGNIPSAHGKERKYALVLALLGIFCLSGLVMSSFVTLLTKKSDKWKQGLIHYNRFFGRYVVIIGVNEQTATIAKQSLARRGVKYVLIQTRQNVESAREKLDLGLDKKEERKIVFYYAERTSKEDIVALHLNKAIEVYVLGEDINYENEEDHDAYNINCLELISSYVKTVNENLLKKGKSLPRRLTCHVNFEYQSTFTAFKSAHIYQSLDKILEFIPFNVHEIWAKKVLIDNFAIVPKENKGESYVQQYYPIDSYIDENGKRKGITKDNIGENGKSVHLVILGMNQMGTAFGLQAAVQSHFPNFKYDVTQRTTITFIDDHAVEEGKFFKGRFEALFGLCRSRTVVSNREKLDYASSETSFNTPENDPLLNQNGPYAYLNEVYGNFMDVQWEFIQGNVASDNVKKYIADIAQDKKKTLTIAICFNHPQQSMAAALYLPGTIFKFANQVLVYQRNSFDMLNKVAEGENDWKRYSNLFPFGMIEGSYSGDTLENTVAALQNYVFTKGKSGSEYLESLSSSFDSTQIPEIEKSWAALGLSDKQSNIDMAESIFTKIRSMGIDYSGNLKEIETVIKKDPELVDALSYSEHLRWLTERLATGYRPLTISEKQKYKAGLTTKDELKKRHRAHLDICSNERLSIIDPTAPENDKNVIRNIPNLLLCAQWLNAIKITRTKYQDRDNLLRAFLFHDINRLSFRYVSEGSVKKGQEPCVCNHSFWIADAPLTKYQWYLVTGKNRPKRRERDFPAVDISKNDIDNFLLILRKKTGLYFSLPSLAEWEYAARLSTGYLSHIKKDEWDKVIRFTKTKASSTVKARALRRKQENPLQIYDMLGNVWEWTDEKVEGHKNCYYFCGGSWRFRRVECDMGDRDNVDPGYWYSYWAPILASDDIGFRLIWKFDIAKNAADNLATTLSRQKEPKSDRGQLLKEWFDRHPMVLAEEGFFIQGTENRETAKNTPSFPKAWIDEFADIDETPHHVVKIRKMKVNSVPVTQELWNIVMQTDAKTNPASRVGFDYPQTGISYRDIQDKFLPAINKLAKDSGLFTNSLDKGISETKDSKGTAIDIEFRLPSESEWEYIAKGGHTSHINKALIEIENKYGRIPENIDEFLSTLEPYTRYSGSNDPEEVAWFNQNSLQPAGKKKPVSKEFNVYDMSGNIWEWVDDYYQTDFYNYCMGTTDNEHKNQNRYSQEYAEKGYVTDPICEDHTYSAHVFRGGSWLFDEFESRCTRPNYWIDTNTDNDLGFRIVLAHKRVKYAPER